MRQDGIPLLMKISESFEIRVNIVKILRNKQQQKMYQLTPRLGQVVIPPAGVGCYTRYITVLSRQFGPARHGIQS